MVAYSFKERFVAPIEEGLGIRPQPGLVRPKRQTIRARGKRRHARPQEKLQLYFGQRTRHCRKIGEARCIGVQCIRIEVHAEGMGVVVDGAKLPRILLKAFAQADGFDNYSDMHRFWLKEHGIGLFDGVLVTWEPL